MSRFPSTLGYVLAWLALAIVVGLAALQVHSLVVTTGRWVINTPSLRPPGWSSTTLSGISSLAYLALGAVSLGAITYLEQELRTAANEGSLRKQVTRLSLILLGILFGVALVRLVVAWA